MNFFCIRITKLSAIFETKLFKVLVFERTPFVSGTIGKLKGEMSIFYLVVYPISPNMMQKSAKDFSLSCGIF